MQWILFFVLFLFGTTSHASSLHTLTPPYQWEEERERTELSPEQMEMPELIIYAGFFIQYEVGDQGAFQYNTTHLKMYLNSEEAIQRNNRIEISMANLIDIVEIRARTFTSDGRVIELNQENVRELSDDEKPTARLFAIEGIDMGSEVEFFFTVKNSLSIYGNRMLQFSVPSLKTELVLSSPDFLRFELKPYNADIEVQEWKDEEKERVNYRVTAENTAELPEEMFSNVNAHRIKIEYKLAENLMMPGFSMFNWNEAGNHFYELIYDRERTEQRALARYLRNFTPKGSLENKVRQIEDLIKNSISYDRRMQAMGLNDLDEILERQAAGSIGMARLFAAVLDHFEIKHELVLTTDRFENRFDPYFESWNYLSEFLIYFPELQKFIAPDYYPYRNFLVPAGYTSTFGLFVRRVEFQGATTGFAYVDQIAPTDHTATTDNLRIRVEFSEELSAVVVDEKRSFSGYNAMWLQPFFDLIPESDQAEVVEDLTKNTASDAELIEWEVLNGGMEHVNKNPLKLNVKYQSSSFIQRAGSDFLFNIGDLIGPQLELYSERQRQLPVENDHLRGYDRKITVQIPEGYYIVNPEDILIKKVFPAEGEPVFFFESTYSVENGVLELEIIEFYNQMEVETEDYEGFRKVINAAADFNKVALLLRRN